MDDYGDRVGIQESSNLQSTQRVSTNSIGDTVFDASQYAFFGNDVVEEVELGGLEDDEDNLEPDGPRGEDFLLEGEEGDASESVSSFDDLAITFSKLNKTVGGSAGVIEDLGSRESSSTSEWAQGANVSNWVDRHDFDSEITRDSKKWSSQPCPPSDHFMESTSLYRTTSQPEHHRHPYQQQNRHSPYSTDPILIPKAPFTSYPPPGGRLRPHSPNDRSNHPIIFHQSSGLQVPISSSIISPFPNPQLEMNVMTHGSRFGGNLPQMPQNQWMNENSQYSDDRSGLFNNMLPQQLSHQNGLVPPKMMLHQHYQRNRMHNPFQPSMSPVSGFPSQLFNPRLSPQMPMMNNFEMMGSPDLRDQRSLSMMRSRQGMHSHHSSELGLHRGDIGWPRFKSKHMSTDEIDNVLRSQLSSIHSNNPYVDDYYHQACLARKVADAKLKHHFCPTNLSDGHARARTSAEPHAFLQVDALGRVSFSSVRRPRPLLEVDSPDSSSATGAESKLIDKPLEQEPMLGARVAIEDGINLLMDVDDIDRFLQFNTQQDGGAQLRQKRQDLLEGLASSLHIVDPLGKNGCSVDLASEDDLVFVRLVSLPKGRKLLLRYLQLLPPGELTRVVCMAIFRHLSFLFCNLPADLVTSATTVNLVKSVSSCVLGMDLKGLGACLASLVCSAEHPPFRPVGSPTGDGATVVLKSILDKATELLTDPRVANNCSVPTRSFWQASFDAFFDLLTKYCFNKYESVVQFTTIKGSASAPDVGSDVARTVSREMPVELLRASLPHTNEQQRKVLLEFAQRTMPVPCSSNHSRQNFTSHE